MYPFYSLLLTIAAILSSPYWLVRGLRDRKYLQNFRQRLGWKIPRVEIPRRPLWIHAVSVGEVLAAKPLFLAMRAARPDLSIIISTVTLTGQALARKELGSAALVFYFPFDWLFSVRRFLSSLAPRAVLLLETELWPNFLRECSRLHIPVILANGRISDKSLQRYKLIPGVTARMLGGVSHLGVQTAQDKQRFLQLGASADRIHVTGNLKFDFPIPDVGKQRGVLNLISTALGVSAGDDVIVAGSTMKGEEFLLLDAFAVVRETLPATRLIIAPRHPERFDEVAELIGSRGVTFQRRSQLVEGCPDTCHVVLLDTIGELRAVYSLSTVALIGGSFLPFGGHNPLEPAVFGKPVIFGPEMSNFKEIASLFNRDQSARQCNIEELPAVLIELLRDPGSREILGQRAVATVRNNQGATERTLALILPQLGDAI
jgi:3-deoxy-D-manno-octulosonic-acid transferase